MVATKIYKKTDPKREAPIPSKFLNRVKEINKPIVVARKAIQKKEEFSAVKRQAMSTSLYFPSHGVMISAPQ